MIILDVEQGTDEWLSSRLGIPTASNFKKIVTSKGDVSESSIPYMKELLGERVSGISEGYQSFDMKIGTEREPNARAMYEFITGSEVKQVGVIFKDEDRAVGCSPDGIVENNKGLEIKCRKWSTFYKHYTAKKLPTQDFCQVQGCMYVTGFKEWDYVSYYPNSPLLLVTVKRDDDFIKKLDIAIVNFNQSLNYMYNNFLKNSGIDK